MRGPLVFRADADSRIGAGHLMRCLALTQAWRERGGEAVFVTRCENEVLRDRVRAGGARLHSLDRSYPDPADLEATVDVLNGLGHPWLVLDGYRFDAGYHAGVRAAGSRLLVIDDTVRLPRYEAELILNQNIGAERLEYHALPGTGLLLGLRYTMLRREFLGRHAERELPLHARKLLVTMGGADPANISEAALALLENESFPELHVRLVVGPANRHLARLQGAAARSRHHVEIVQSPSDMPGLMAWSDLAVTAAGSTCWELAYLGVPLLAVVVADNQAAVAAGLRDARAALVASSPEELTLPTTEQSLLALMRDPGARADMSCRARSLVDGLGAERVLDALESYGSE